MIGATVGNYRIIRELGKGAMGTVYQAEHQLMQRQAAVKLIREDLVEDPEAVARFVNEARTVNEIRHPNIVEITDLGQCDNGYYLIMELLEGETLGAMLARHGPLDERVACHIAAQVASALVAAHAKGVIHRDLKPDNIFVGHRPDYPYFVKVLDFGIAKLIHKCSEPDPGSERVFGTPQYMSPEQFVGETPLDHRSDIYSLGVVLYEMLAGSPPFCGDSFAQLLVAHVKLPPPSLTDQRVDLSEDVEAIVSRTLEKCPVDRFPDMRALRDQLCTISAPSDPGRESSPSWFSEPPVTSVPPTTGPPPPEIPAAAGVPAEADYLADGDWDAASGGGSVASGSVAYAPAGAVGSMVAQEGRAAVWDEAAEAASRVASELVDTVTRRIHHRRLVLPPPPSAVSECMELLLTDRHSATDVAEALQRDPQLAAHLLESANRVSFGDLGKARTLAQAIGRLGQQALQLHLIEWAVRGVFDVRDRRLRQALQGGWHNALAVALVSRKLVETNAEDRDGAYAYLMGLLCGIGRPIVGAVLVEIEQTLGARERDLLDLGIWLRVIEACHRDACVALSDAWCLPPGVVRGVAACGGYNTTQVHSIPNYVYFANALATREGFHVGAVDWEQLDRAIADGMVLLDLSEAMVMHLTRFLRKRMLGLHGVEAGPPFPRPDRASH